MTVLLLALASFVIAATIVALACWAIHPHHNWRQRAVEAQLYGLFAVAIFVLTEVAP